MNKPVLLERKAIELSTTVSLTIMERVRGQCVAEFKHRQPKARRKWEEVIRFQNGEKYAVECKEEEEFVEIRKIRRL